MGDAWRIATVLAVANGFAVLTLAITYLVPVVSAATEKRQLAAHLHALGSTPQGLLLQAGTAWASTCSDDLGGLGPQLQLHQERHHTYPVLHYFHSGTPDTTAPLRLAALDEALTIAQPLRVAGGFSRWSSTTPGDGTTCNPGRHPDERHADNP